MGGFNQARSRIHVVIFIDVTVFTVNQHGFVTLIPHPLLSRLELVERLPISYANTYNS